MTRNEFEDVIRMAVEAGRMAAARTAKDALRPPSAVCMLSLICGRSWRTTRRNWRTPESMG